MEKQLIDGHYCIVFSEEEKKDIIKSVSNGNSVRSLMRKYHVAQKPIYNLLDEYGIDHSRGNLNGFELSYPDGIYSKEIEDKILYMNQNDVDHCNKRSKYSVDHYYFDDPYTEDKIYTLGFLYSDGNVSSYDNAFRLSLEEHDWHILNTINNNIKNEKQLRYIDYSNKNDFGYHYKNQYQLTAYSKHMVYVLQNLGVYCNKSLILEFPKWLKPEWYAHFVRGVFDGDGSVYLNTCNNKQAVIVTITSTENFCNALVDICAKYIGIRGHVYDASCHNGITKVFTLSGRDVSKKFLDWIYNDATIYLQRKYNRYLDYYNINNSTQLNELVG